MRFVITRAKKITSNKSATPRDWIILNGFAEDGSVLEKIVSSEQYSSFNFDEKKILTPEEFKTSLPSRKFTDVSFDSKGNIEKLT